MTKQGGKTLTFAIGESGDVEWLYDSVELTTEEAMVIVYARGFAKIASAIENLASAVGCIADKMQHPDDIRD
nr:hypothetical protein [uncultured Rhodopila sp.]